ncbi:hypothetical protein [Halopiger goleimassiliensis]|uniref:hypothetical protein n=1 Tax=Halopiger goleimassiliensis TaxID=1293048 RepID=UPI0006776CA1|nr:hypothetical protein [Halopiger goleimassiliensis]
MTYSIGRDSASIGTAVGLAVVLVAIVGTQFLGWEWGDGRFLPTMIGIVAAVIAVVLLLNRRG